MQGESDRAEENELLGEFILTGLRRSAKGSVEIEVTFEINADGIVSVHAEADLETAKEQSIEVTASSGLTRDEVKNMLEGAKDYMVERRSTEELEAAKQEAERLIGEIERLFPRSSRSSRPATSGATPSRRRAPSLARLARPSRSETWPRSRAKSRASHAHRMFKGVVARTH